jgi:DNA-binding LacI/PurR family transcriptional regulator/DNA-binding transcriptional regulator YhcF (GntR family)
MAKKSPVLQSTCRFLRSYSLKHDIKDGQRLPTIIRLSKDAGVGLDTMVRAVRFFSDKGILHARPGAGLVLASGGRERLHTSAEDTFIVSSPAMSVDKREHLRHRLLKDIIEGPFHEFKTLPSLKQLSEHYGTHFRAVKKAVSDLVKQGYLTPYKKTYRMEVLHRPASLNAIHLILDGDFQNRLELAYFRTRAVIFFPILEREAFQRNISVVRHTYQPEFLSTLGPLTNAFGFIIVAEGELIEKLDEVLAYLRTFHKPIVVLDWAEEIHLTDYHRSMSNLHIVRFSNFAAGAALGRFLVRMGHRQINFFAMEKEHSGLLRIKGLRDAFRAIDNNPDRVTAFFHEDYASIKITRKNSNLIDSLNEENKRLVNFAIAVGKTITGPYFRFINSKLFESSYTVRLRIAMQQIFADALSAGGATAWVGLDDYLTMNAMLPFLQSERVNIPRDLSVASFNDTIEASTENIVSYRFDIVSIVLKALSLILFPKQRGAADNNLIEIEGGLIPRASVAVNRPPA